MRAVLVFVLLFATVLCRPARKFSVSSSESSEEVRRPVRLIRKQTVLVPQTRAAPVQNIAVAAAAGSDESSDEDKQVIAEAPMELKADSPDTTSASDTDSVTSQDSADDDDDDDDTEESETEEEEEEEEESSNSSESGESSTPSPATITPMVVTDEPVIDATEEPVNPTIVVDPGRGDNLGGYPSDYKSIIYVEDKSYHKMPSPYKSYEFVDAGKKTAYDMTDGNEVEKTLKVYKVQALQVHADILEEDTSTPDVESQGLDTSFGTSQDQDLSPRQASVPEEEDSATTSESASASQEAEDEDSESEEATATPGAADSDSDEAESSESSSEEQGTGPDITTDMPLVITAK